jgi:hypothetical protein
MLLLKFQSSPRSEVQRAKDFERLLAKMTTNELGQTANTYQQELMTLELERHMQDLDRVFIEARCRKIQAEVKRRVFALVD